MINSVEFENRLKKGMLDRCYIFCGTDEQLIKEAVKNIIDRTVSKEFSTLNYIKFDGSKVDFDTIVNACETVPFMSDKKAILIYRAPFLEDKVSGEDIFKNLFDYINDIPPHCVLIMYYIFQSEHEKPSFKLKKIGNKACVVEFKKLKGMNLEKKVKSLFDERGKQIGKVELSLFCNSVDNNFDVIKNEVEKLCCYTIGRDITREDINILLPQKSENDIFDLVNFLSQKKPEKALDIINELLYRGEKISMILSMIERQYKILFNIKLGMESGKNKNILSSELRLHPYVCEKMMSQSKKFTLQQLKKDIELCLITEKRLKSVTLDEKTEMELLIINCVRA